VLDLTAKTPCDGLLPVSHGPFTLTEIVPKALTSIAPFKGQAGAVSDTLQSAHGITLPSIGGATGNGSVQAIWFGQGQYLLTGPAPDGLDGIAAVTDQTDAWATVRLDGHEAAEVLARLVPVDMRPAMFPDGTSVRTLLGHMTVSITREGEGYRIMAFRSMAVTLVHEIAGAMEAVAQRL
tara:strand:- start:4128 stop:4667 length:540 start_codon:yes stop_codon:yes gene_type:complete